MANDDVRQLLDELSSQLLLCDVQNSNDFQGIDATLDQMQQACNSAEWEIIAGAAKRLQVSHDDSEELAASIRGLTLACVQLEQHFHTEPGTIAKRPNHEELVSLTSQPVDDWGFGDAESEEEVQASVTPSFVMGGTGDVEAVQDIAGEVRSVQRQAEEVENMIDFYSEAQDAIDQNERLLLETEEGQLDDKGIAALFRAFHTIKGVAGFVGLTQPTKLAHSTESLLGGVRRGAMAPDTAIVDLLLESNHCMQTLVESVRQALEASTSVPLDERVDELCSRIDAAISEDATPQLGRDEEFAQVEAQVAGSETEPPKRESSTQRLSIRSQGSTQIRDTLKVDVGRVDSLVEMVGEMVIVESMITGDEDLRTLRSPKLANNLRQMAKITRDLQKIALQLRMVPVRGLFTRTARMVRELSRQCGKEIRFRSEGEGTEMDRNMVELLADPMVHIIRNAADHGIESATERTAAGKSPIGSICISAYHESSNLVIEITDDGRGLNVDKLLSRGYERGLITTGQSLSESEVYELIFAPGLSTADSLTGISGRGVGMDVVRKNIKSMRGRIGIQSKPGEGTTFRLVLPLTLAIIDGTLISCGGETYILPTLSIIESIRPKPDMVRSPGGRGKILQLRGKTYPLYRLASLLEIPGSTEPHNEGHAIIVESGSHSFALQVDDVVSQQQVVIKGLEKQLQSKIFSGAAILSDGQIGLIINIDEVVTMAGPTQGQYSVRAS
tara:strand:+ start:33249 stop:35435 length:2187 start_codon:yes stop_codon:yes gene_type:complete